ncbi:hypothetical protein E2562_003341 [Oryza meyeriana var. granulata]|uniref:Myb-like domain-containing protein n=1 Tax=Oryza meyeriana var. granulata TaxID=110450 RepID=A0A6G1EE95_9ORYZ|nr:hypothetical protein E2562_003341 [Oryza meyeriana var. granulata]
MSPATAAAVASCGFLRHQPPASPRPASTKARFLPLRGRRPLRADASPRRLPAAAVRAQRAATPGYLPESEFYKVEAILRPWRVPYVSSGLLQMGIRGVTVSDVRGFGAQGGSTERHEGSEFAEDTFIDKVKMEIVVSKDQVEAVVDKIIEKARTGEIGDGKIFWLRRTGKSCRLRWLNYLRPDVRRGNITPEEQLLILDLHSRWGNRWSKIAQYLPGRTDNEIKNYWRTRVQKHAKQLRCDVNSKQFRDVVRHIWMPRLVERIQADSVAASAAGDVAVAPPVPAVTRSMSSPAGAMYHHHQQIPLAAMAPAASSEAYHHHGCAGGDTSCSEPSQMMVTMSPDDASSTLRSSSLTTEAAAASHLITSPSSGGTAAANDVIHGDVLSGSWSELLATTTTTTTVRDASTAGLPDFDELGDFEDNLWSLEDIWLHQQC